MMRTGLLVLLLLLTLSFYLFQHGHFNNVLDISESNIETASSTANNHFSSSLELDQDAQNIIHQLIQDVSLSSAENNITYAIQLDHQTGRPLWNKKKYKEAYQLYKKILAISYYNNNLRGIQIALGVVADVQKNLGLTEQGLDTLLLAYKIALLENLPFEYGVLENVIADNLAGDDKGLSLMWRLKAKEHLEGTPYVHDYVSLLTKLADDLKFFNKDAQALRMYKQAYEISAGISSDPNVQWIRKQVQHEYARALINIDQCDQALDIIKTHLNQYQSEQDRTEWYYAKMHFLYGQCQERRRVLEDAYQAYMTAYSAYEYSRSLAKGDEDRAHVDSSNFSLINTLIQFHINADHLEEALQLLETNKARTLSDIAGDEIQKDLYQQWKALQVRHVKEREALLKNAYPEDILQRTDYVDNLVSFEKLLDKQRNEEFALKLSQESKQNKVSRANQFQSIRYIKQNLPADTAVISLFVDNDTVGLFLLTQSEIRFFPTEFKRTQLKQRVQEINYMISNPYIDFYKVPTQVIYDNTFRDVLAHLDPRVKKLVISKDGYFKNLSIGILFDGASFMDEQFILQEYPSLRFYDPKKREEKAEFGISCVDPDVYSRLPFQKDTSDFIKAISKVNLTELTGSECSVKKLEKAIINNTDKDVFLHVGAHGSFHYRDPMESGLLLSPDLDEGEEGLWNAIDIGTLNLDHVRLVTLSSCETGLNDQKRFRDLFGINRTLIYAGVENIISPVWAVSDYHTSLLMQDFYKSYLKQGDPAYALHQAKLSMIKSSKYQHPYYWGGFVSMGGIQ